jgi:hypothetical protein
MDNSDDTNRSNALPGYKVISSENKCQVSVLRQILGGGIGGLIIAGILTVPVTLLLRCPQLDGWQSILLDFGGVLVSAVLGGVLLVMLRPVLRKVAGLDRETKVSKMSKTDEP